MTYSKDFMKWVSNTAESFSLDFSSFGRRIDGKRKGFIVVDTHTGKVAYSWCNPADNWNDDIGIAIAYARLRNIPIPEMEELPTIEECTGKWVETTSCKTIVYVTPIKNTVSILTLTRYGDRIYLNKRVKCKVIQ